MRTRLVVNSIARPDCDLPLNTPPADWSVRTIPSMFGSAVGLRFVTGSY